MKLDEILKAVVTSQRDDWCQVKGGHLLDHEPGTDDFSPYDALAVYRPDVAISLVWGRTEGRDFREPWANRFPDPSASMVWFDIRYHGAPILREVMVAVDGSRCYLPLPNQRDAPRSVPEAYSRMVRLLQQFNGPVEYDEYFRRAGLRETKDPWPRQP
jgi:hypothetical protein